jgi:transposase
MSDQFWLTKARLKRIEPFFPRARGVPRVDHRRVVSGIIHVILNGLRWRHFSYSLWPAPAQARDRAAERRGAYPAVRSSRPTQPVARLGRPAGLGAHGRESTCPELPADATTAMSP